MNSYSQFKKQEFLQTLQGASERYLEIAEQAESLVKNIYKDKEVAFPIDINLIAKSLGIEVIQENLNFSGAKSFNRILGRLEREDTDIWIKVEASVSYKTQRYAIAHSIARYLLKEDEDWYESSYAIPLIPQSLEEILGDVLALFLLLPMETFKREFSNYLKERKEYPMDVDLWLQYLSDKSQISLFNLSIGYQQLKQVLCLQRQKEFEANDYDITKMEDAYERIFA